MSGSHRVDSTRGELINPNDIMWGRAQNIGGGSLDDSYGFLLPVNTSHYDIKVTITIVCAQI
ncbi:hypothetical protein GCM10009555_062590 [Acrocarpospora macrocephala]|uniref:Uncharacterized protein n=1 Tax=Acrocarpospora macrocephala TaxID=150177 RepID=A0A5M3WGK8_9ACTN|nr:hypothetical protein [Acrocarpospora macrocephala]GES07806.1 hypothetical protein Amac_014010 [Acrocarpospora macrocephala]